MNFSHALEHLKGGRRIARRSWVERRGGAFLTIMRGHPQGISAPRMLAEALGIGEGTHIRLKPYILHRLANTECVPWVPSQDDLLANDWDTIEDDDNE